MLNYKVYLPSFFNFQINLLYWIWRYKQMAENSELSEYTRHIPLKKVTVNMPQPVTTCLINMKRDSQVLRKFLHNLFGVKILNTPLLRSVVTQVNLVFNFKWLFSSSHGHWIGQDNVYFSPREYSFSSLPRRMVIELNL